MAIGWWQIVIIVLLAVLLFGRGRISDLMGDVAKGIKSFRKGLAEDEQPRATPKTIDNGRTIDQETQTDKTKSS